MRRYVIALVILAVLIGSLFKAADQTGVRLMKMFGTLGIFLFGVVGTMALTRMQSRSGLKELETALKSLEPKYLITDWAYKGGGRPDYLLVGPGGIVALCLEETPQSAREQKAADKVAKGRERVQATVRWLRDRLNAAAPGLKSPLGDLIPEMPVEAVLLLTRRRTQEGYSANGVTVVNAEQVMDHIRSLWERDLLDEQTRIKLTRMFRSA